MDPQFVSIFAKSTEVTVIYVEYHSFAFAASQIAYFTGNSGSS